MPNKKLGVIYLLKDRLQLYLSEATTIIELPFPTQFVRDFDILDKENFETLIKAFILTNQLPSAEYSIVIGDNAAFIRDFSEPAPAQQQTQPEMEKAQTASHASISAQINTFIEHVPFEHVVSKTFPLKNGTRVFAINKDLYDEIQIVLDKQGSSVTLIIPAFIVGNVFVNKSALDVPSANYVLQHLSTFKQYNLLEVPIYLAKTKQEEEIEEIPETPKQKDKKRLYALVGVFVLLLAILIVVAIMNLTPPAASKTVQVQPAQTVAVPASPIPTTVPTIASLPADAETQNLTISILSSAAQSIQPAQTLQTNLQQFKFRTVTIDSQKSVTTPTTIITFSARPTNAVRTLVIDQVKKVTTTLTVQDKPDAVVDVSILLANN